MHIVDWSLWLAPVGVLVGLAAVIARRGLHRDFPFFLSYIVVAVIATVMRISVRNSPHQYFVVYWTADAALDVLALLTLNEVFKHMFAVDYKAHWWFRLSLPILAFAIALFFLVLPVGHITRYPVRNAIFSFDLGMHSLEALIMLLFVMLDKIFKATYDPYDYGIVRGFGVSASVTILADVLRSHFGTPYTFYFTYAPPVGFIVASVIWLHAFLQKPPEREKLPITIQELLRLLAKQYELLEKISRSFKIWRFQGH